MSEIFWAFRSKKSGTVVRTAFYVSRSSIFSSKNWKTAIFLYLQRNTVCETFFGRLVKSVLVLSTVTIWGKPVFCRIVFSVWDFDCKFYAIYKTNSTRFSKFHFACPQDFFGEKGVFLKYSKYFSRSCNLKEMFWAYLL